MDYKLLLILLLVSCFSFASDPSPYAGEENRAVKSLSEQEITALRKGDGMGFAKLAELNHYPGPKHVLEISTELGLSSSQVSDTQTLYDQMNARAVAKGEELIAAESRLDKEFEEKSITAHSLEAALLELGRLRAELRFVHLEAHLKQAQLLSADQILKYDSVRGYQGAGRDHSHHSGSHK